jgi:hypothetical protein
MSNDKEIYPGLSKEEIEQRKNKFTWGPGEVKVIKPNKDNNDDSNSINKV